MHGMFTLAVVPLVVWLSVFAYMVVVDRKLAKLEARVEEDDL